MSDTGNDWAATAERLRHRATQNAIVRSYGIMPSSRPEDDDLDRAAAVGLRRLAEKEARLAQLDTAIEQHRTAHVTEGHPGDEPWSCCNDDFYLWAVLGSGEQPEGPTTPEGELCD